MIATLRLGLWLTAIFFSVAPVLLAVARSPGLIEQLFQNSAYKGTERDLLFGAIAILAVGLVDAFEAVGANIGKNGSEVKIIMAVCLLLSLVLVMQICVYSFWTASMHGTEIETGFNAFYIFITPFSCALMARLLLVFGGS